MADCTCDGVVAHDDDCPVAIERSSPEWQEAERTRVLAQRGACERIGHPYDTEIGVGFGNVDYFCKGCGHIVRTVPVNELSGAEARRIGAFVTETMESFGDIPWGEEGAADDH